MLGGKDTTFINEHQVRELANKLKHCVISILDKNSLCPIIACQCLFWKKMYETYIDDVTHYMIISCISEDDLLLQFVDWYKYTLKCDIFH